GVADAEIAPDYYAALLSDYTQKRQMMMDALLRAGFDARPPEGAYYVLADFTPLKRTHQGFEDDHAACETLVKEVKVGSIPGSAFFETAGAGKTVLRFCFAKEFEVLAEACNWLASLSTRS